MCSKHNPYDANCYYLGAAGVATIYILYHANCYHIETTGVTTIVTIMQIVKI